MVALDIPLSITGKTQVLGIIGDPIAHSLSPPMQNAALRALGWDGIYVPFPVRAAAVDTALAGLWALGVVGFNVTIPHKQAVMAALAEVTPLAQAVGAVNTVWRQEQGWAGTNTDVLGFVAPLQDWGHEALVPESSLAGHLPWSQRRAVILGNGGAARAAVAGCSQLHCGEIWVVGRDRNKLQSFAESWQDSPLCPTLQVASWDQLPALLPETTLLVNTTPLGMHPREDQSPVSPQDLAQLPSDAIAYDLIYTPSPTQFLRWATERGLHTIDGVEMLVQQGAAALEIWIHQPPPIAVMRHALKTHLGLA
ncbi:shikimate dehydrogenase [Leptolyngbya sp. PCC 6406]|uniref:shikimate dehydrogenase n=1 Tax=Leptolyngbya sp. PCC 6406 TaxID=1173264 RepID=UPI0002AC2B7D|nr:shikimate dehydrogenase [Leptolyngbya sp. PCC 6406]